MEMRPQLVGISSLLHHVGPRNHYQAIRFAGSSCPYLMNHLFRPSFCWFFLFVLFYVALKNCTWLGEMCVPVSLVLKEPAAGISEFRAIPGIQSGLRLALTMQGTCVSEQQKCLRNDINYKCLVIC